MLTILFYYLSITTTCVWTGYFANLFFRNFVPDGHEFFEKHAVVYALWGLIVMVLAAQVLELFLPVNQYTWMAWVLILAIGSLTSRKAFIQFVHWLSGAIKYNACLVLSCCAILLFVSNLSAGPLMMDDTESYHIQMIKWIQAYGTVPGLANLHERYGFNSSWFTFVSLFIPAHTPHNFYAVANGTFSVWIGTYLFSRAFPAKQNNEQGTAIRLSCFVVLLTALFCWPMIRGNATTANYDFITTCLLVVLMIELCGPDQSEKHWKMFIPELIIWPVFLFTVRIINFPLLLISFFGIMLLIKRKTYALLTVSMLVSAVLIVPFLARNVVLSGYLFFPVYQINLFQVDWKADIQVTKRLVTYIKYYNRVNNAFIPIGETRKLGFPEWIPVWFRYLFNYDKPVLIAGICGYLFTTVQQKTFRQLAIPVKIFAGVMVLQLISWFIIAPDPRFVYGPLLTGIFLLFLPAPTTLLSVLYRKWMKLFMVILPVGMLAYTLFKAGRNSDYRQLLMPVPVPQPVTRLVIVDHIQLRIPEKIPGNWNPRCYATELPCLYEIHPGLTARGKTAADGFKLKK